MYVNTTTDYRNQVNEVYSIIITYYRAQVYKLYSIIITDYRAWYIKCTLLPLRFIMPKYIN